MPAVQQKGLSGGNRFNVGRHDFDFYFGKWHTVGRKLVDVTDPECTEWIEFEGTGQCGPILGGLGNVDTLSVPKMPNTGEPMEGATLRLFDPATRTWRIWWMSSRQPGVLDTPVEGGFNGSHGTLHIHAYPHRMMGSGRCDGNRTARTGIAVGVTLRSWHDLESMALADLGISVGDERVYRFLLDAQPGPAQVAAQALELPESEVAAAVARMAGLGLLSVDDTGLIVVADPRSALDALAQRKVLDSLADFQRMAVTRSTLPDVLAELGKNTSGAVFERIAGVDAVTARMVEELNRQPAGEVRSSKTQTGLRRFGDDGYTATVVHLRQGTRYRTLVRHGLMNDPVIAAYYHHLHQIGDVIRVTNDQLQSMSLFDKDRAFVPLEADNPAAGAMFIQHSGLVATLVDLFDRAWRSALDLDVVTTQDISSTEQQILVVLAETAKDEVAARHLGISVRTFRRHVSDLMERLHADNRFQLAVIAKDKGWLTP